MITFYAQFTASKMGVPDLTVTVDVWRVSTLGVSQQIVTGSTEVSYVGGGVYSHTLAGEDLTLYEYLAVFTSAEVTVDLRQVPTLWTQFGRDARVTAEQVLDKTGYSLASYSIQESPRPQDGSRIVIQRGDSLSLPVVGLGDLSGYTILDFALKASKAAADTTSIIYIRKDVSGTRLVYLNGSAALHPTHGSMVVNNLQDGNLTITVSADEMAALSANATLYYDIQGITAAGLVTTLRTGKATISEDVIKAIS